MKENRGMSLIIFTIILAILVVVAGGVIVYLLNNPIKEKVAIQNQITTEQLDSSNEIKQKYTENLIDAQNGEIALLELIDNEELKTTKSDGYYTYLDPFENKYKIKEIKEVISEKGMLGTDNNALFKVTVTYIDNNNQTKTMKLAIILLSNHEVQNMGTYDDYTGTTSFMKSFGESYDDSVETSNQTVTITTDEKFAEYVKNLKAAMLKYNEEETEGKEYREYIIDGKNSNDENYSITLSGNGILKLNEKEVANNVIGFNVAYVGNGGYKNLYFIKDDGTVAYASIDETEYLSNGKIKTKNVDGLKNIVSIMGGVAGAYGYPGACYGYAIDIEGNMFEI